MAEHEPTAGTGSAGSGPAISRRRLLQAAGAGAAAAAVPGPAWAGPAAAGAAGASGAADAAATGLVEAGIPELQARLAKGELTSVSLVRGYLRRIAAMDDGGPSINSVIELNPDAVDIARRRDAERAAGRIRGPLHGIPVLLKDNIATADRMETTAGSLALVGCRPGEDATVARRLRAAGAVILGKTNLSEWANFRGIDSSSGWSGRGGLTRNPYVLDRTASGSSSGSAAAVAASLAAVALGTETDGSILSPSAVCGLVGIKPTVGLTSRAGVIPISHSQDTVGPMARTVTDAAITLGALVGPDPRDPVTAESAGRFFRDYTPFLRAEALQGARLGVPRTGFWGFDDVTDPVAEDALRVLRDLGATLVEAEFPDIEQIMASNAEITVLLYEFKHDVNAYLASLPARPGCPRSLADLIAFNRSHADVELQYFGQELFELAQRTTGLDSPAYLRALAESRRLGRGAGVDAMLREHDLQAIVAPTMGPAGVIDLTGGESYAGGYATTVIAISGYPGITVPMGFASGLPLGLCFLGTAYSEPTLLSYAYAYEQASRVRRAPRYLPTGGLPVATDAAAAAAAQEQAAAASADRAAAASADRAAAASADRAAAAAPAGPGATARTARVEGPRLGTL